MWPEEEAFKQCDQKKKLLNSVTSKKWPKYLKKVAQTFWHIYKNCLKMWHDMGKIIVATVFEKLPKVQ